MLPARVATSKFTAYCPLTKLFALFRFAPSYLSLVPSSGENSELGEVEELAVNAIALEPRWEKSCTSFFAPCLCARYCPAEKSQLSGFCVCLGKHFREFLVCQRH